MSDWNKKPLHIQRLIIQRAKAKSGLSKEPLVSKEDIAWAVERLKQIDARRPAYLKAMGKFWDNPQYNEDGSWKIDIPEGFYPVEKQQLL